MLTKLETKKLVKILFITAGVLVALNIINVLIGKPSWQITRLISLEFETNITAWFSSMLLAVAAFLAYQCAIAVKTLDQGKRMWQLLSVGLLAMSCDETAMIHESLGQTANKYFFNMDIQTEWLVIFGPIVLLVIGIFIFKLRKYLKGSRKAAMLLLLGALTFITGAFFFEFTINFLAKEESVTWLWQTEIIFEESFEMFGVILIIWGLGEHCKFLSEKQEIE